MQPIEALILDILGQNKFTKRRELRTNLISRGFYINDRMLRRTIEKMITEDHYCLQSSERGYSLITTLEDLEEAKAYLKSKAMALLDRMKHLELNYEKTKLNQLTLFQNA